LVVGRGRRRRVARFVPEGTRGEPVHGMLVAVLGSFRLLHAGHVVSTSPGAERLLAFVALHSQPVARLVVAGACGPRSRSGAPNPGRS
jgi:hypothetical protein